VHLSPHRTTESLSNQLLGLEKSGDLEVLWDEKKDKPA
jgi:hypothetical protein